MRAGTPSVPAGTKIEPWIDNRVSVASSSSTHTITPVSFNAAGNQLQNEADKHASIITTSSASHHPVGVFPIPIGDNGGMYTIRRPFLPSLSDELGVATGDVVVLVRAFDDGWAFVSKTQVDEPDTANPQIRGLIPIECFSALDPRASTSSAVSTSSRSSSLNS